MTKEMPLCHAPPGLPFACLKNEPVSRELASHGSIVLLVYVLEETVMKGTKLYRDTYNSLSPRNQRTLINHHVSLGTKVFLFLLGIIPFMRAFLGTNFSTPLAKGSPASIGDFLYVCSTIYTAMYAFELVFRTGISYIAWVHHIGAAVMAQVALDLSRHAGQQHDASMELMLCLIWGFFDIVSEAIPHFTLIIYRLWPEEHARIYFWFRAAFYATAVSTLVESAVVLWIYTALFSRWRTGLKVATPCLHLLFTVAQCWSAYCLWQLGNKHKKRLTSALPDAERIDAAPLSDAKSVLDKSPAATTTNVDRV